MMDSLLITRGNESTAKARRVLALLRGHNPLRTVEYRTRRTTDGTGRAGVAVEYRYTEGDGGWLHRGYLSEYALAADGQPYV